MEGKEVESARLRRLQALADVYQTPILGYLRESQGFPDDSAARDRLGRA